MFEEFKGERFFEVAAIENQHRDCGGSDMDGGPNCGGVAGFVLFSWLALHGGESLIPLLKTEKTNGIFFGLKGGVFLSESAVGL